MIKRILAVLIALSFIFLVSCGDTPYSNYDFFAMNTYVSVVTEAKNTQLETDIKQLVLNTEKGLSAHYGPSEIAESSSLSEKISEETKELLKKAHKVATDTNGAFDYTLGALIKLWNINGSPENIPSYSDIMSALSHCGYEKISYGSDIHISDSSLMIDLGAVAKGYTGDRCIELIKSSGIKNAAISLGGNITVTGSSEKNKKSNKYGWDIGINNPFDTADIIGNVLVSDTTVSVSGSYERFAVIDGKRYHHIFDSKTGFPAESHLESVAVICKDGALADALSTALFVMGYERSVEFYNCSEYDFEAIFCTSDGKVLVTDGFVSIFSPNFSSRFKDGKKLSFPQFEK